MEVIKEDAKVYYRWKPFTVCSNQASSNQAVRFASAVTIFILHRYVVWFCHRKKSSEQCVTSLTSCDA